jgi:hypothetical protein
MLALIFVLASARSAAAACPQAATTIARAWEDSQQTDNFCSAPCPSECVPSALPLPACDAFAGLLDTEGCWANSSLVDHALVQNHVSYGASTALRNWLRVWLPRRCSYFRRADLRPATCPRLARLEADRPRQRVVWWLLLLGDSGANRGLYCHLYALLVAGTEKTPRDAVYHDFPLNGPEDVGCGGLVRKDVKTTYQHATYVFNETHELRFAASRETNRVFSFYAPAGRPGRFVRVSWAYTRGLVEEAFRFDDALRFGREGATPDGPAVPDEVVVGAGIYDYRGLDWSDEANRFTYTEKQSKDNIVASESRREGVEHLMEAVARLGSRFWYRTNHCQSRFPAVHSDVRAKKEVVKHGGGILDTLNFSVGVWLSQTVDGFHYDREPWRPPAVLDSAPELKHVGELVSQAAQSVLLRLCNLKS